VDGFDERLLCRACGEIHPDARLVTLPDGRQVGNYSEAHRLYNEARWVLRRYRVKSTRQAYLRRVAEQRGSEAAWALREEMLTLWEQRRK
jgi:hypothetical protein